MDLDASSFLLQWSIGGMLGCWYTTRRREVGIGYGWLLRIIFGIMCAASSVIGALAADTGSATFLQTSLSILSTMAISVALLDSVVHRRLHESDTGRAFRPVLDAVAVVPGLGGLVSAGVAAGGGDLLAITRLVVGAVFLGFVTDAMLLGHWYLVQPGLPRRHVHDIVRAFLVVWPIEVAVMLVPTGMFSVLSGAVDDGWGGMLGWFWVACALATGILGFATTRALREPSYSAVMAATGLMYLAILTAFGTDLVARAILAS